MNDYIKQDLVTTLTHAHNVYHITSYYVNRLQRNRAHRFLNQASQQCSCPLGSVVQLEACRQQRETFAGM